MTVNIHPETPETVAPRRGQVRSFRAQSMEAATELVRRELGTDAIIVSSRQIMGKGRFPWSQTAGDVIVTARSMVVPDEPHVGREQLNRNDPRNRRINRAPLSVTLKADDKFAVAQPPKATQPPNDECQVDPLPEQEPVEENLTNAKCAEACQRIEQQLLFADVEPSIAAEIAESLKSCADETQLADPEATTGLLNAILESQISTANPLTVVPATRRVIAVVGPSGVGKTTTLSKLAAHLIFNESASVALITFDTFRIAAVEQLRTYAGIIEVPVHVVTNSIEMERAIDATQNVDFVLIDTGAHNPNDEVRMQQLKQMLAESEANEVVLCLSATAGKSSLQCCGEKFAAVGAASVIVTKTDEACGPGSLLTVLNATGLPLAYTCDGQNVPADLEPANSTHLARMISSHPTK